MPVRTTLLFAVTTDPGDRASASPHSGGWSESFYIPGNTFQGQQFFSNWATARAQLLAGECSIIGYRQQLVTISKNRLLPGGSAAGTLNVPGVFGSDLNAPQDSLMVNFTLAGQPQQVRHKLPGIPDSQVSNGEYQPAAVFKGNVTKYMNLIISDVFAGIARDLTQPDARVKSLAAGVLTTMTATGAAAGDFIRLRRVKDDNGNPVEGTFLVQQVVNNADTTVSYTLVAAPNQTVTKPNGTARHDLLVLANITNGVPNRLVIRKVGRPFVQYRGRRSKRRV
jgi:hypothetical protein